MKIGIDVGGSHLGLALINEKKQIIIKKEKDYVHREKDMSEIVIQTIIQLIKEIIKDKKIKISDLESIGIAFPGTVANGIVVKAENLGIKNLNIESELKKEFNLPIFLNNDAKCAAVIEKELGSLREYEDALFLIIGTGVGGAVFLNNKLLKPKKYSGFEVGHMVVDRDGPLCNCGRHGCFEVYGSVKRLRDKIQQEFNLPNADGRKIKEFIIKNINDKNLDNILTEYINNLVLGLANLINIFEPEAISIGGSFVYYKDIMIDKLADRLLNGNELYNKGEIPKILVAEFKNDAGIIGATMIN